MGSYVHDPDADLDYGMDWDRNKAGAAAGTGFLAAGETISTSTWTISPEDANVTLHDPTNDTTTTTVWVAGGTPGARYTLTNHIITSDGREDDRTHTLRCANR